MRSYDIERVVLPGHCHSQTQGPQRRVFTSMALGQEIRPFDTRREERIDPSDGFGPRAIDPTLLGVLKNCLVHL